MYQNKGKIYGEIVEAEKGLRYLDEHALTKKELKVELIVLDQKERPVENAIGHLFRKYNIMEYKSPTDYFSIDDYYKVSFCPCTVSVFQLPLFL